MEGITLGITITNGTCSLPDSQQPDNMLTLFIAKKIPVFKKILKTSDPHNFLFIMIIHNNVHSH